MNIVGLLNSEEEVEEIKFVSKIFLVAIRIHEIVEGQMIKDVANKITERGKKKVDK